MPIPFQQKTTKSSELFNEAIQWIPGGVTANIKYFKPYPIVMEKAKGPYLYDVDGNEYIDFNLCYGTLILGHGHPEVTQAFYNHLIETGTIVYGTPHELEITMAQTLSELFPSIEKVRFTNSGLEATLLALRLAMAWTKRKKIAKFEGHYHGSHDQVLLNVNPTKREKNQRPDLTSDSLGLPDYYLENTIILPFNDIEQTAEILEKHQHEIAAVIMEPIQGGYIPPDPTFLKELRRITNDYQIALIFDEVKTGFRVGISGAQGLYGITPDLTALGKVLGGGFPIGAVGGRSEIMELSSPTKGVNILTKDPLEFEESGERYKPLFHSGTYNGHPLVLSAGLKTIEILKGEHVYKKLESNTLRFQKGIEQLTESYGIPAQTIGVGSIFNIIFSAKPIQQIQDVLTSDLSLRKSLDDHLINRGVYLKPMNRFSMSTAHVATIVDQTLERFEAALNDLTGK